MTRLSISPFSNQICSHCIYEIKPSRPKSPEGTSKGFLPGQHRHGAEDEAQAEAVVEDDGHHQVHFGLGEAQLQRRVDADGGLVLDGGVLAPLVEVAVLDGLDVRQKPQEQQDAQAAHHAKGAEDERKRGLDAVPLRQDQDEAGPKGPDDAVGLEK